MLKKTIKFLNLDEEEVTRDFYFHIGQLEWAEINEGGAYIARLEAVRERPEPIELVRVLKEIIMMSIGQRSEDNLEFLKTPEYAQRFTSMHAYEVLMTEFAQNPRSIADFIFGVMPKSLRDQMDVEKIWAESEAEANQFKKIVEGSFQTPDEARVDEGLKSIKSRYSFKPIEQYTDEELVEMSKGEFDELLAINKGKLPKKIILLAMHRNSE